MLKKCSILFISLLLLSTAYAIDSKIAMNFIMIEMSINKGDTVTAHNLLDKIASDCEQSEDWECQYKFYKLRGYLNYFSHRDLYISDYQRAFEVYPMSVPPTQEYLTTASDLCWALVENGQFDSSEAIATKALVRGSVMSDSCLHSARLFSILAMCYEHRGDTIMPQHFHKKSQILGLRYHALNHVPDSIDIYNERINKLFYEVEYTKAFFDKKHPNYLLSLNELAAWVMESDNFLETIHLGEQIQKLARDSMMTHVEGACDIYSDLLYCYAYFRQQQKAVELLPQAVEYFNDFPNRGVSEAILQVRIGLGLMDCRHYKEALPYLQQAKRKDANSPERKLKDIDQIIKECKKHI